MLFTLCVGLGCSWLFSSRFYQSEKLEISLLTTWSSFDMQFQKHARTLSKFSSESSSRQNVDQLNVWTGFEKQSMWKMEPSFLIRWNNIFAYVHIRDYMRIEYNKKEYDKI